MKWNIGQFVGKVGKKTKERRGKEDEVQTFVNYIQKTQNTYFIFRVQGGGDGGM